MLPRVVRRSSASISYETNTEPHSLGRHTNINNWVLVKVSHLFVLCDFALIPLLLHDLMAVDKPTYGVITATKRSGV